jgi:hypothetical protein
MSCYSWLFTLAGIEETPEGPMLTWLKLLLFIAAFGFIIPIPTGTGACGEPVRIYKDCSIRLPPRIH